MASSNVNDEITEIFIIGHGKQLSEHDKNKTFNIDNNTTLVFFAEENCVVTSEHNYRNGNNHKRL